MAVVSRWVAKKGLAFGILSSGIGFGPLIIAPLGTYMIARYGWRLTYVFFAAMAACNMAFAITIKENDSEGTKGSLEKQDDPESKEFTPEEEKGDRERAPNPSVRDLINMKVFWQVCLIFMMVGVGVQTIMAHVVAYSEYKGISPLIAASVLSTLSGISIIGRLLMGWASDRLGRRRALIICTSMEGIMILWLMGSSRVWMLIVFGIFFGFFYGGHAPQLPALVGETLGLANVGAMLGVGIFFWSIGSAIGPYITGYLFDMTGSYSGGFMIGGTSMFIVTIMSVFIGKKS
jgi:MFS family permease